MNPPPKPEPGNILFKGNASTDRPLPDHQTPESTKDRNMTLDEAKLELSKYVGTPICQDCKWKLGSEITDFCACVTKNRDDPKHTKAFNRARELQTFISANDKLRHGAENQ